MLSQVLIWLNIGLPIVGLGAAVAGLAVAFHRHARVEEDVFDALELRDRLNESASAATALIESRDGGAPEAPESPLRPGVAV